MYENNVVYKGYKLCAKVSRIFFGTGGRTAFTATVSVGAVTTEEAPERHDVPFFASGGFVANPGMAVHAAINHGRNMVDAHSIRR